MADDAQHEIKLKLSDSFEALNGAPAAGSQRFSRPQPAAWRQLNSRDARAEITAAPVSGEIVRLSFGYSHVSHDSIQSGAHFQSYILLALFWCSRDAQHELIRGSPSIEHMTALAKLLRPDRRTGHQMCGSERTGCVAIPPMRLAFLKRAPQ